MAVSPVGLAVVAAQGVLLLSAIAAFLIVLKRVGYTSVYGRLFFTNALGLWVLFTSFLLFNYEGLVLQTDPTALQVGHLVKLVSYLLVTASFLMLGRQFETDGDTARHRLMRGVILGVPTALGGIVGLMVYQHGPGSVWHLFNALYLLLNGLGIGAIGYCFLVLLRLGNSLLARFYLLFGLAVLLNALADFLIVEIIVRGGDTNAIAPDIVYALGGAVLVGSAIYHARALARQATDEGSLGLNPYEALSVSVEDKALSCYVRLHGELLGSAARKQLEAAAWDLSLQLKRPVRILDAANAHGGAAPGLLATNLSRDENRLLLQHLRDRYHRLAGANSNMLGARVSSLFGGEFDFLAR